MSRIRTIKPEYWTSEQVVECSTTARLLFIGMWNFADDGGNMPASVKTLKMQIFPGDDFSAAQISDWVGELISNRLVIVYLEEGREFWHITGWKHQKIEKPSYKYPAFKEDKIVDRSSNGCRKVGDRPPAEGSLRESSLMDPLSTDVDKGGRAKRATRLPKNWVLPDDFRQAAIERGLSHEEIDRQAARILNWSLSAKAGAKLDWYRAWLNWIDDAPKARAGPYPEKRNTALQAGIELMEEYRREELRQTDSQFTDECDAEPLIGFNGSWR